MDGHDLLSAALDECGLGDLFSNEIVQHDDATLKSASLDNTQEYTHFNGDSIAHSVTSVPFGVSTETQDHQIITAPNSIPLQYTNFKKIVIKKLPISSNNNEYQQCHNLSDNNNSAMQNIIVNNNRPNIVTLTTISSENKSKPPSPMIISPQIVTIDSPTISSSTINNTLISKQNNNYLPTVNLNPISQTIQPANVISNVSNNNKPIIIRTNSKMVAPAVNCQQQGIKIVPIQSKPAVSGTSIKLNGIRHLQPTNQFQTVQFVNTKLMNSETANKNSNSIGAPAQTSRSIVAQYYSPNIIKSNSNGLNNIQNTTLNSAIISNNPLITVKSVRTTQSTNNTINNSTIVKLVQSPSPIPTINQQKQSTPQLPLTCSVNRTIFANKPIVSTQLETSNKTNSLPISKSNNNVNSLLNRKNSTNKNSAQFNCNGGGIKKEPIENQIGPNSQLLNSGQQNNNNDIMLDEVKKLLEEQQEEEEFANLETFHDYMPAKLKIGSRHPDQVVETASLASIPPPDVYYRLAIPDEVIDEGRLSALQLESIIYASQQHETILPDNTRAGFLIGDGAGVGKGRTVAGIIYENYLQGRKRALWFSVSTDLKYDAERDLFDISANKIDVHLLNKFKYGHKIHSPENDNVKRGIIFSTYNSLIGESTSTSGKYSTRFNQIIQWCGEEFDGAIIFDECHKAKNLFPCGSTRATKTGQAVVELQRRLPNARVVYASATGATEPRNMGYMTRLGIWGVGTPFEDFNQFVSTVEKRGVGAMELVAIDLKMRGMYMARQLSFNGVQFRIEHVPLSREFIRIYNCCCRLWVSAKTKFEKALDLMGADHQVSKAVWTQFWASHQRFFKYLCIASKVKFAVAFVKEALRCNKSVVIGLQSTGEARTIEQLEDNGGELSDFVSTAKAVFQSLIEKHFPAPNRKKLAKLLGEDTSFFDQLGIKLSRNENDEIITSYVDDEDGSIFGRNSKINLAKKFFDNENDSDDDDFVDVDDCDEGIVAENDDEDDSDMDSDDLSDIDDIMDEKLGLKRRKGNGGASKQTNSLKFMDILLGPSSANATKSKPKRKKIKTNNSASIAAAKRKSMRNKYEKFYSEFDNVGDDVGAYCERLRDELLQQLESFGERLPPNTLDELIDELGGPENVAEMTGRKGRIVSTDDGNIQYEARTENDVSLEMLNMVEKQRFMDDEKRVAIISEAASSGISLHADRRVKNRWRRVHLTVELPWSADRAIQQFGRTHRSNQVSAPEYVFLISNLAGENRFASIVAKRLESLGALTHGDRRATESRDLSQFNIDTKYGRQALEIVMKTIAGHSDVKPLVDPPDSYSGDDFFEDCREGLAGVAIITIDRKTKMISLDKDFGNINKFLNRILGLEVELQNSLFRYFNQTMDAVIKQAKRNGRYDSGIIDLSSDIGNVSKLNEEKFILKSASGATKIQLHTVLIDRGISFEKAKNLFEQALTDDDYFKDDIGFYVANSTFQILKTIFLAIPENTNKNNDIKQIFRIYKPSLGLQSKYETKSSLRERGEKISNLDEAEKLWNEHYEQSEQQCSHLLLFGRCRQTTAAMLSSGSNNNSMMRRKCDVGLRKRTYCILSGSVLTVWPDIEKTIPSIQNHKLQIVRLKTEDGFKFIGPMIPPFLVDDVRNCLNKLANPMPK